MVATRMTWNPRCSAAWMCTIDHFILDRPFLFGLPSLVTRIGVALCMSIS